MNNSSTTELAFNVVKGGGAGDINVICTKNPASSATSFIISHDRSSTEADVVLEIFDTSGRAIYKRSGERCCHRRNDGHRLGPLREWW